MMQYVVRSPEELVEAIDNCVDGARFKSRNQLINVILANWVVSEAIHPVDDFAKAYGQVEESEQWLKSKRDATRRRLLGDEWEKYKAHGADVLDGHWDEERAFERMERESQAAEQRERLKAELRKEIRDDLRVEISEELDKLRSELKGGIHAKTKKTRSR